MTSTGRGGSASLAATDYWWYRARTALLGTILAHRVGAPQRVLDVGSADGPSVGWLHDHDGLHVSVDIDPRGLSAGGVCGSALLLPFGDDSFDVVGAFDVVEHCEPESVALAELQRVLKPGGTLMLSVPAYQWAWSSFDDANGHHRRYTRGRAVRAVELAGLQVDRATYAFAAVFPLFAAQRVLKRAVERLQRRGAAAPSDIVDLPPVSPGVSGLLMGLCRLDQRLLRRTNLPFGSSVVLAASKAPQPAPLARSQA
ncbi:methyltransferase domain-containing protein [Aeromicrobium chenweiae]|uniref:Class I SAM-dependent methyltransferase n=1 Tax=Aeromicrobium chenweiae TaxID=2079793 RepID=A0A2S0WKB2_9ACTN|nr:methyltransferase domain-containing protein [Aeromicrobium chenweiae]AWB91722.1 class I SAM-dependent methyltransferase [Aeromicrobium chenweiae]TGN32563.1 SAM-dependent methyltransferase [Aeromicrobium chenweiae]